MRKRLTGIILIIALSLLNLSAGLFSYNTKADKGDNLDITFTAKAAITMNFREGPGTDYDRITDSEGNSFMLPEGQKMTIIGKDHDGEGNLWYRIKLTYKKTEYIGYGFGQYINVDLPKDPIDDDEFEASLTEQGFPDSYKPYLRFMHIFYPEWRFVAVHTGLSWNDVLDNEYNSSNYDIKNVVWTSSSSPNYNWRSTTVKYNILKDTWVPCDGTNWFAASDAVVKYYLDPRTYLDESHIFAFESLSYIKGVQTKSGVNNILKGTFMAKGNTAYGDDRGYADIIMSAAKETGVSPYHIASRIRLEMGSEPNAAADGSYNGCYNYFNIGAYDGDNALVAGLNYAASKGSYGRPWNTVEKSIVGGAQFLASGYISVGQNTLYTQKFNVTNAEELYAHQYCTNVQMPYTESVSNYAAYYNMGALDSSIQFEIPVYTDLPNKISSLPSSEGNPNNYLSELKVDKYELSPAFAVGARCSYSLTVGKNVSKVNISAVAAHSGATVSGTGKIKLGVGTNIVNVKVTSESGTVRKYKLTIIRGEPSDEPINQPPDDNESVNKGDLNGDGSITTIDIVKVQRLIVGLDKLTDHTLALADINGDGVVTALDIVFIQRHIVGLQKIKW